LINKAQEIINEANKDLNITDVDKIIDYAIDKFNLHRDAVAYLKDNASELEAGLPQFSREEDPDAYPEASVLPSEDIFKEAFSLRMAERNQLFYDNFGVNGDKAKKIYGDWLKIKGRMQDAASKNLLDIKFINC
jgi:hypothetical protein